MCSMAQAAIGAGCEPVIEYVHLANQASKVLGMQLLMGPLGCHH